jgi:hypothetical protein
MPTLHRIGKDKAVSHNAVPGKEMMLKHGITFKKIPRDITRF